MKRWQITHVVMSYVFLMNLSFAAGCPDLTSGWYETKDKSIQVKIVHNPQRASVLGYIFLLPNISAQLLNSYCSHKFIKFNWNDRLFSGELTGDVAEKYPTEIINLSGNINGKVIHSLHLKRII